LILWLLPWAALVARFGPGLFRIVSTGLRLGSPCLGRGRGG